MYQGTTPKRKETISSKILLNHVQMLALLSGIFEQDYCLLYSCWYSMDRPVSDVTLDRRSRWLPGPVFLIPSASFIDSRIIATDCALDIGYFAKSAFFMLIPVITLVASTIVHIIIYFVRAYIVPCFQEEDVVGTLQVVLFFHVCSSKRKTAKGNLHAIHLESCGDQFHYIPCHLYQGFGTLWLLYRSGRKILLECCAVRETHT